MNFLFYNKRIYYVLFIYLFVESFQRFERFYFVVSYFVQCPSPPYNEFDNESNNNNNNNKYQSNNNNNKRNKNNINNNKHNNKIIIDDDTDSSSYCPAGNTCCPIQDQTDLVDMTKNYQKSNTLQRSYQPKQKYNYYCIATANNTHYDDNRSLYYASCCSNDYYNSNIDKTQKNYYYSTNQDQNSTSESLISPLLSSIRRRNFFMKSTNMKQRWKMTGCDVNYECQRLPSVSHKFPLFLNPHFSSQRKRRNNFHAYYYCSANMSVIKDPLVQVLPRYNGCTQNMFRNKNNQYLGHQMHGWPVLATTTTENVIVPYYSSHGNLLTGPMVVQSSLEDSDTNNNFGKGSHGSEFCTIPTQAVIVIHGADRNADDYFCSILSAAHLYHSSLNFDRKRNRSRQYRQKEKTLSDVNCLDNGDNVWVIAPRFTLTTDLDAYETLLDPGTVLQWEDDPNDNVGVGGGTWRYGGNAVYPPHASNVSSFQVIDSIVHHLLLASSIERITVVGHSSGGQFVQRWALLTSAIPPATPNTTTDSTKSTTTTNDKIIEVRTVVANPSSYAYLSNKRRINGTWTIPDATFTANCPYYNRWQFGLEPDFIPDNHHMVPSNESGTSPFSAKNAPKLHSVGSYRIPYVDAAIHSLGGSIDRVIERFGTRHVIYLIGNEDQCDVPGNNNNQDGNGWCKSHGLETLCQDMIQGRTRYERHWNYFMHLIELIYHPYDHQKILPKNNNNNDNVIPANYSTHPLLPFAHKRRTVEGVGHDHSLMFNSDVGMESIFSIFPNDFTTIITKKVSHTINK